MSKPLTWVEINKSALNYNIAQFRKLIGPDKLLMPVIKSNAYGHGFLEVAQILNQNKEVDRICVVSLDEAIKLINAKIKKPILIIGFYNLDKNLLKRAIQNNVIFTLYDLKQAEVLNNIAKHLHKNVKIHLEIDTGASRTGILPEDTLMFLKKLKKFTHLELEGIWSHFASSEEDSTYTYYQLNRFRELIQKLEKNRINIPIKHMACSASSILYHDSLFNGIRLGLSLYGLYPSNKTKKKINLKPVLSWYTKIIQIKYLPKNTKIGYGGTYITKRKTKLAIIPVGYWDGYNRLFSNKAQVLIKAKKCPIRGRICMNLSMVDITNIKNVKVGDKVILIGKSKNQQITADDLAQLAFTINYEIVTRINPLIPRFLV
jgi:alanine racemase